MDEKIIDDFRNFCNLNALKLSAKVELLLKREMENAPSNPTLVKLFEELVKKQNFKNASLTSEQEHFEELENVNKQVMQSKLSLHDQPAKKIPTIAHLKRVKGL